MAARSRSSSSLAAEVGGDVERRRTEIEAQLARSGRRLEAIQRYRALTNATIEEARLVVMAL
jgi:hypothetical protein